MTSTPFAYGRDSTVQCGAAGENHVKRGAFMGKAEAQGTNAVQMATGVALGGLLALGLELTVLLLGALGMASMWEAVFADVGVAVIAILNSMRTLKTD